VEKISIDRMSELIKELWAPLNIFQVNDTAVRLVKIKGKYHWHQHSKQDELFIVLKGQLKMNLKNQQIVLDENEGFVVKKGILHQSEADQETLVLLVEPSDIVTKGDETK
jgi:mannose-6-phosphate isomerase-like protein (cupin superfamily)